MDSKSRLAISDLMLALTPGDGAAVAQAAQATLSSRTAPLGGACLCPITHDHDFAAVLGPRFGAARARDIMAALRAGQSDGLVGDVAILRLAQEGTSAPGADRLLAFDTTALDRVLAEGWPSVLLTPAERRVLLVTLAGLSLPMAAALDGVGTETRRSQFKSLSAKLGLGRRTDLIRQVMTRLAVQLAASDGGMEITPAQADYPGTNDPAAWPVAQRAPKANPAAAAFRAEIAPVPAKGLRTLVLQDHAGAQVRVVDAGPRDGRPVIILHPQIFPLIGPADAAPLFHHQIRALWPIRQGALVPDGSAQGSLQSLADQIASTQRAVIALQETFCNGPATVVGLMSGAPFALQAAAALPQTVGRVILVGAAPGPLISGGGAGALRRGLIGLARANPGLLTIALGLIQKAAPTPADFARILRRHYRASAPDLAVITHAETTGALGTLHRRFMASLQSVRIDFQMHAGFDWAAGLHITQPLHLIHGAEDPIQPAAQLAAFAALHGLPAPDIIPAAGQFLMFDHLEAVIARTGRLLGCCVD